MKSIFNKIRSSRRTTLVVAMLFTLVIPLSFSMTSTGIFIHSNVALAFTCADGSAPILPAGNKDATLFTGSNAGAAYACQTTTNDTSQQNELGQNVPVNTTSYYDSSGGFIGSPVYNAGGTGANANLDKNGNLTKQPAVCTGSWYEFFTNFFTCGGRSISAFVASVIITIAAWVLQISASLFNWLVFHTIVQFGSTQAGQGVLTPAVNTAITTVWTAFRDIANILIIGMFVFIAISTILGISEYGYKKLLANVLIIAILINFSLLFTKIIIDASNFTATQFYTAASLGGGGADTNNNQQLASQASQTTTNSDTGSSITQFTQAGIAGQLLQFMGVTSISNTFATLQKGADVQQSGPLILLHGIFSAIMLLAAAMVLFYGSFLLIARSVLLIFLLITSSLAFASYLIPRFTKSGWESWWSSLLGSAVLAPILMVFLWATMLIAQGLKGAGTGTLGDLLNNPTNGGDLGALFTYIIILALLFATFKVASSFSTSIGGFNFAAMVPGIGAAAAARVAAFTGRNTIGRASAKIGDNLQAKSRDTTRSGLSRNLFNFGAEVSKGIAKRDMNMMRTPLGAVVAGTTGMKMDALAGKKVGGFAGQEKKRAQKYAEKAANMTANKDDREAMLKKARQEVLDSTPELAQRHTQATESAKSSDEVVKRLEKQQGELMERFSNEIHGLQTTLVEAERSAANAPDDTEKQMFAASRRMELERRKAEHSSQLTQETNRIKDAKVLADRAKQAEKSVVTAIDKTAIATGKLPEKFETEAELASKLTHNRITNLIHRSIGQTEKEDRLAKLAYKEVGDHHKKSDAKAAIDYLRHTAGEDHGAPAAVAHTPAPAAAPHAPAAAPAAHDDGHGGGGGHH